ncbi:fatty acyl-AMP ligase [Anabaena catenula]|uniref:Fatty acyl-AMP ligase n=1 Tax=Anabaena catenula FACHB-362 TaxID=2692877 RepID=A0ABR8J9I7_9NOST|nr:fatty acyl-AMP ligase [Anabaena catenula]MBD2694342.1 fatty acyl-AMP ligase [Anabaena catenula FACHB-362]
MQKLATLVELLRYRAQNQPDKIAFTFLLDGETESNRLTYQELDRQARAIAATLQTLKATDTRALLLYPFSASLEFIAGFLGCLYAGVVAVTTYPPRPQQSMSKIQWMVADTEASLVLTTTNLLSVIERESVQTSDIAELRWLATDSIDTDLAESWQEPVVSSNTLAYLQYTSGSTGTFKGVQVTHDNILHNEQMIQQAFEHSEKTIFGGWLPLYHDMGLVGNVLQPLYLGIPSILISPVAFIQKPFRWLQLISRYKVTTSGGPNFAYELCIHRVTPEQRASLDLGSWELAFNGAEPVRAETLKQFTTKFEPCGFRFEAFYPCYGMAETTLFISGGLKTSPPTVKYVEKAALEQHRVAIAPEKQESTQAIVSCGKPWLGTKVVIVDTESLTLCPTGQVGEIWVSGPGVAKAYWNRPEETVQAFQAYLADSGEGPFLRTGDLGFLLDGELFVTGRLKDIIIIWGNNHYPQHIEQTVEQSHPALRHGCGAVFAVQIDGEEQLVIAQEVERSYLRNLNVDEVVEAIRMAVATEHVAEIYAVLLLKTGSIPKTSSGKIQRHICRTRFLDGSLDVIGEWRFLKAEQNSMLNKLFEVDTN